MNGYNDSWIKLPRAFCKWQWYKDSHMVHLYLHLLLNASFYNREVCGKLVKRGQMMTTLPQLSRDTGLSIQTIRTCLKKLTNTRQIKNHSSNHYRVITILDYNSFQPEGRDEINPDWIKLYRKIRDWQWYDDSFTFHLFIHLLLNASAFPLLCNGDTIGRGQVCASRRSLSVQTHLSERSVRTCLKKLQSSNEIVIFQKTANRTNIITICKYESYQNANSLANRLPTGNQQTIHIQNLNLQQAFLVDTKNDPPNFVADYYNPICYEEDECESNRQLADQQQAANRLLTNGQQTPDRQSTALNKNERKIRKEEKILLPHAHTHTEDDDFVSAGECEDNRTKKDNFSQLAVSDAVWMKTMGKRFYITDAELMERLNDFVEDMICRGKEEGNSLQDFKSHFCDWLEKNISKNQKYAKYGVYRAKAAGRKKVPDAAEGILRQGKF